MIEMKRIVVITIHFNNDIFTESHFTEAIFTLP